MEDLKTLYSQSVEILKKIDAKTDNHSVALKQISDNTHVMMNIESVMKSVESAMERIATSLESSNTRADDMTKSAMNVLDGKSVIGVTTHIVSMSIMGIMFIICIVAIARVDFHGETSNGTKASISQHDSK